MNLEDEQPSGVPESLKKAMDLFNKSLKKALGGKVHIRPAEKVTDPMLENLFSSIIGGVNMTSEAVELVIHDVLPAVLNETGVRVTLFTRYMQNPPVVSTDAANRLLQPKWKIHAFNHRALRSVGDNMHMIEGDKVVVASPDDFGVRVLSYYVTGATNLPDDDDYRISCNFAGGCTLSPELFTEHAVRDLRPIIADALFDKAIATPPINDELQDLFNDPEYKLINYTINE